MDVSHTTTRLVAASMPTCPKQSRLLHWLRSVLQTMAMPSRRVSNDSRNHHVAAAQNALRQEDIDVALDIERHAGRDVRRIDRDNQAYRYVFGLQHLGEFQRTISAHRVPDQDDRSGIPAILANRRIGDQAADREFVDIRGDAGVFDLFGQTVHPA